jgi:hypothetical protein
VHRGQLHRADVDEAVAGQQVVVGRPGALTLIWREDLPWSAALRSGELVLHGEPQATRALPRWLKVSSLAPTPRPPLRDEMLTR